MKHPRLLFSLVVAMLFVFPSFSRAKEVPQRPVLTVIDGAKHANQIPDVIAYRLYFFVLTNEAQDANVGMLNLDSTDRTELVRILNDFKTQDSRIRESHATLSR